MINVALAMDPALVKYNSTKQPTSQPSPLPLILTGGQTCGSTDTNTSDGLVVLLASLSHTLLHSQL